MELLLAVLIAKANQTVSSEQLINEIWGNSAPRRATATLHVYISQLRKLLAGDDEGRSPIVTRGYGYQFDTSSQDLDVDEFHELVRVGRGHFRAGDFDTALQYFETALALWRGPVFGEALDSPAAMAFVNWLEEERLECLELMLESSLMLGRHRELVGRLYTLVAEHPLRESLYRLLMIALYRSERQSAALEVYRSAHELLNAEIGLEPCRSLRDIHQAILVGDDDVWHERLPQAV